MTLARSTTLSASLRVTIEQISSATRSIGIIHTVIDSNIYVCIDCNATHIILHHYIATSHYVTATRHPR